MRSPTASEGCATSPAAREMPCHTYRPPADRSVRAETCAAVRHNKTYSTLGSHVVQQELLVRRHFLVPGRRDGMVAGPRGWHVTTSAAHLREDGQAPPSLARLLERRGWGEQPNERVGQLEAVGAELRIGRRIGSGGQWLAGDGAFVRDGGTCDADLSQKCAVVELAQRRHERLASEASQPAVEKAIRPTGNAIAIAVVRVGVLENLGIGYGVEQPAAKDIGRRALRDRGGLRRHGLLLDAQRRAQQRSHAVLEDGTAQCGQLVARAARTTRMECGGVMLDFLAHPTRYRVLMARRAGSAVEQGAQALLGREGAVEYGFTAVEARPLGGRQAAQRLPRLRRSATRRPAADGHPGDPAAGHGFDSPPPARSMV